MLGLDIKTVRRAKGCPRCNNTGYSGRLAIHEIVTVDKEIRKMITGRATMEEITEYAVRTQEMKSLKELAEDLLIQGVTTVEELIKVAFYS